MSSWSNRETQLAPYTAEREQQLKAIILRKTRPAFNNRFAKLLNGKHNHLVPKRNENQKCNPSLQKHTVYCSLEN